MRLMENLESRTHFALDAGGVDLGGQIDRFALPPALVAGQASRGSVTVGVTNLGDTVSRSARPVVVTVTAQDAGGAEVVLGSGNVRVASLAAGQRPRFVSIPLRIPPSLQSGEYTLKVTIDPGDTLDDANRDNNTLVATDFTVEEPAADIVAGGKTVLSGQVRSRSNSFVTATVRNDGNINATFVPKIEVIAELNGDERVLATSTARRVTIAKGRTGTVGAIQYKLPSDWTEGNVTISVRVTPVQALPSDDEANNVAELTTVTIVKNPEPEGPLAGLGLDSTLRFFWTAGNSSGGRKYEEGNFVDSQGRSGTYELTRFAGEDDADFVLRYQGRVVLATVLTYRDNSEPLGGRTLEFGVSRGASNGYIDLFYRDVYFAYVSPLRP